MGTATATHNGPAGGAAGRGGVRVQTGRVEHLLRRRSERPRARQLAQKSRAHPTAVGAGAGTARPCRGDRAGGADAGAGPGPDPLRADVVSAFTFYRGAAAIDGGRSRPDAAHRAARAAVRRRPPLELRRVRRARPAPDLRRQRLRRDAARAVRVGRQAARRELRGRRPRPRLRRQAASAGQPDRGAVVPRGDPGVRRDAGARPLVRATRRRRPGQRLQRAGDREAAQALRQEHRQGTYEGQHAGLRPSSRTSSTASSGSSATHR